MASPGGTSSGSSSLQQNSSSEEDIHVQIVDERKRKRMQSNRESARRSRLRKQKHLDDLMEQVVNLRKVNGQILSNINITTQQFVEVESENSVLRAQMSELSHRLQSLNEINNVLGCTATNHNHNHDQSLGIYGDELFPNVQGHIGNDNSGFLMNPWDFTAAATCMNQPIMASADMFQY